MRDFKSNREIMALSENDINTLSDIEFKTLEARVRRAIKSQGLTLKKFTLPKGVGFHIDDVLNHYFVIGKNQAIEFIGLKPCIDFVFNQQLAG